MTGLSNRRSVMTLYADTSDPLGHSVRLVLREKDINSNVVLVPDGTRPEILNDFNPYDTTLTLVDRDLVLYDSHTILEYLDERYPHPPLMPVDPVARANNRQFRYRIVRDLYKFARDIIGENEVAAATARKARHLFSAYFVALTELWDKTRSSRKITIELCRCDI